MDVEHLFDKVKDLKDRFFHSKNKLHEELTEEERRLDEEKRFYEKDHPQETPQDKVVRESGGRDISAI